MRRNGAIGKKIDIFFAIPCGEFFSAQSSIIKSICTAGDLNPVIVEDHSGTGDLWKKISSKVDSAEYFIADISSLSPNIMLELGYCIGEKRPKYFGIFVADNTKVPVDLQGHVLQKYSSIRDFQSKLIKWVSDNVPFVDTSKLQTLQDLNLDFTEHFKDYDRFLRLWTFPPQCSFELTHEGLRFTNAHFPIMTTHLALLRDYRFKFKVKIESKQVGWIVKGTKPFNHYLPTFCVMFIIDLEGNLIPHIFNYERPVEGVGYRVFNEKQVKVDLNVSRDGWFTITTTVIGDTITIAIEDVVIFEESFAVDPFKEFYEFADKQGEIGFRCWVGEQAIINCVEVQEIESRET